MRRFPDLLIGFLIGFASLLIIFVLTSDFAAHYEICEKTNTGAKECADYNVLSYGFHKFWAALDALNTAITAIATAFIAWFTFSLRRSTDRLWDAGERQLRLTADNSATQSRDMQASIAAAAIANDLNRQNFEASQRAIILEQRPWLRWSLAGSPKVAIDARNVTATVEINLENIGKTPALNVAYTAKLYSVSHGQPSVTVGIQHIDVLAAEYGRGLTFVSILPAEKTKLSYGPSIPVNDIHVSQNGDFELYLAIHAAYQFFDGGTVGEVGCLYLLRSAVSIMSGGAIGFGGAGSPLNLKLCVGRPHVPAVCIELPSSRRIT